MLYLEIIFIFSLSFYFLFTGVGLIGYSFMSKGKICDRAFEKISIVIAARNEYSRVDILIESLLNINYPKDLFEIIIVNDYSQDNTIKKLDDFRKNNDSFKIRVFENKGFQGKRFALDIGIRKANHNIIALTDSDCMIPENWLVQINQDFSKDTDMLVGEIDISDNYFKNNNKLFLHFFQKVEVRSLQTIQMGFVILGFPFMCNGANLVISKKKYIELNGFSDQKTTSGDDIFLLDKFSSNGLNISSLNTKKSKVLTLSLLSYKDIFNQKKRWLSKLFYLKGKVMISAIFILIINWLFFLSLIKILFVKFDFFLISFILFKIFLDYLLSKTYRIFSIRRLLYFLLIEITYPIYLFVLLLSILFSKGYFWKNKFYKN